MLILSMESDERMQQGADGTVSGAALRVAMGHFATGVTVVTSRDADGKPVGTTTNAVSSLSLEPPLVLVCFALTSATLAAIDHHRAFGVNVLAAHHQALSTTFARHGATEAWETLPHRMGATDTPRLSDVIAHVECTVEHRVPGGDHEVVIGRVVDVEINPEELAPLLFYRGAYGELARG